jgi:hypothetical protein
MFYQYKTVSKITCLLFFIFFSVAGQATTKFNSNGEANFYDLPASKNFISLSIKGYQQTEDYTCGPAAAMSLLQHYQQLPEQQMNKTTEMRIAKEMSASMADVGTSPKELANWFKQRGFEVNSGTNGNLDMLRENLRKGIPTLVEWIDWGGHWVIVTGYYQAGDKPNPAKDTIFFADPAAHFGNTHNPDGITSFNVERFQSMWFDAQYFKPGHLVKGVYMTAVPRKK